MSKVVSIFGAPRSGTSWLGQVFNSSPNVAYRFQPLFSYAFKSRLNENSTAEEIDSFHRELLDSNDPFLLQEKNISGKSMELFAKSQITHLVWKEVRYHYVMRNLLSSLSDIRMIGLVRHPCAVLGSWFKAPKEFDVNWDVSTEWRWASLKNDSKRENYYGYEKWKEVLVLFHELHTQYPDNFRLVRLEDIRSDLQGMTSELFDFAGIEVTAQTTDFLDRSVTVHSNDPYAIYKTNTVGESWRNYLPATIQQHILRDLAEDPILHQYYGRKI